MVTVLGGLCMENKTVNKKKLLEVLVITLFLTYGIHYFGYFIRVRYYNLLDPLKEINPGLHSIKCIFFCCASLLV